VTGEQSVVTPSSEPGAVRSGSSAAAEEAQLSFQAYNGGETFMGTCPDCGSQLEYAEGCVKCHVCGFSECG
jgi:ribonucleoside-diphosphate reductase alpha chain